MQLIRQSEGTAAYRKILFFAFDDDSADNFAPKTGQTFSTGELRWKKAGVAEANAAGTVTEIGGGWYEYEATTAECDTMGVALLRTNKTDVYSEGTAVLIVAFNPYAVADLGLSRLDAAVTSRLAASSYEDPSLILSEANGIETGITLQQAIRLILAAVAGRRTGIGTGTELYRDFGNAKNRITMVFDGNGNTTSVTYDAT